MKLTPEQKQRGDELVLRIQKVIGTEQPIVVAHACLILIRFSAAIGTNGVISKDGSSSPVQH